MRTLKKPHIRYSEKHASEYMINGDGEIYQRPNGSSDEEWITVDTDRAFDNSDLNEELNELDHFEKEMDRIFGRTILVLHVTHFKK
jgi:hypothetical protein